MKQGVGAWSAFRWKGTTLYPRGISRQVLNTSNVKKSKKVPTATNSIVCSNDVAQQGWFSARSRKCSDYKHTEHQRGLMLPSSSTALHTSLVHPPQPAQPSFGQECGHCLAWAFRATARSGLASFPLGRNINWGSRLPNLLLLQ